MSKAAFIEQVANRGKISKAEAKRAVELVLGEIEAGLKSSRKEAKYSIGGFGVFSTQKRKARTGRNPRTGEAIKIKASKVLKLKPAKALKDAAGC